MEGQKTDVVDKLLSKLLTNRGVHDSLDAPASPTGDIPAHSYSFENAANARIRDAKLARLVEQLSHSASTDCHQRRAAALGARVNQMEAEAMAASSARRRAEQEAHAVKAELSALQKSFSLHRADHEREIAHCRAQLNVRTDETASLERDLQKVTAELARVRSESERQQGSAVATERRLRDRVITAERRCDATDTSLHDAENRAAEMASALQIATQGRVEVEREASRVRDQLHESRREVHALQEELTAAKDQLESCLAWNGRRCVAEEALKEGAAQRATLAEECRGLRKEVGRLESALMEERANRERVAQQAEHKLVAAAHEAAALRAKLDAKVEDARAADAQILAIRADAERMAEVHRSAVSVLQDKLSDAKRTAGETRTRAAEKVEAAEAKGEEKSAMAAEAAVSRYQRRIQDLELQMAHMSGGVAGYNCGGTVATANGGHAGGVPGGFAASVLDYIPRSEHLRLMETRGATREAEYRAQLASVRAEAAEYAKIEVAAVTRELQESRLEVQEAKKAVLSITCRAEKAEHELALLQNKHSQVESELQQARDNAVQAAKDTETQRIQLSNALSEARKDAKSYKNQLEEAVVSVKAAAEGRGQAEHVATAAAGRCQELENAMALAEGRCDDLAMVVQRLQTQLEKLEGEKERLHKLNTTLVGQLQKFQHRCAEAEAQANGALRQAADACSEAERTKAAAISISEEASLRSQNALSTVLLQLESCLGISDAAAVKGGNSSKFGGSNIEARTGILLSRCKEIQSEVAAQALATQRAQSDANDLAAALAASQTRCSTIEAQCRAVQEQYNGDLEALERAARDQVQSVRARAEEAIAGVRRASTKLQERLSIQVARAGSLAEEVDGLRARLAQQTEQANSVEEREKAMASLLEQLTGSMGASGAAQKEEGEGQEVATAVRLR